MILKILGSAAFALVTIDAMAQTQGGAAVRSPYVTSTGETVQKPGVPQASGPTRLDRRIRSRTEGSIGRSAEAAELPAELVDESQHGPHRPGVGVRLRPAATTLPD